MEAADILQTYLDKVGLTVMVDDWPTYRDCICLPCHIVSHDENKVVSTEAELKAVFENFGDMLRSYRVTDYIRLVDTATKMDEGLISGSYVSHLLSGTTRILPPFRSQMTLRLMDGIWRAASVTNGLANSRWPLLQVPTSPDTDLKGRKE